MQIVHKISLDLMEKKTPARIQVKQGDTLSRSLEIVLYSGGAAWPIPADVRPIVRWAASNQDTGETAGGIYDTLPNGEYAFSYAQNQIDLVLAPQLLAMPGLVQCDLVMLQGEKVLSTFNFEIYVNRVPIIGRESQSQDWYKLSSLEQINEAISALQEWQTSTDGLIASLEHEISSLKEIINEM